MCSSCWSIPNSLFLCYVLSILVMINGEWLVLFTLIWTPYLSVAEVTRLTALGCSWPQWQHLRKLCVKHKLLKAKKWPQTHFFTHILEREMSHTNNRRFREASASQNTQYSTADNLQRLLCCGPKLLSATHYKSAVNEGQNLDNDEINV